MKLGSDNAKAQSYLGSYAYTWRLLANLKSHCMQANQAWRQIRRFSRMHLCQKLMLIYQKVCVCAILITLKVKIYQTIGQKSEIVT